MDEKTLKHLEELRQKLSSKLGYFSCEQSSFYVHQEFGFARRGGEFNFNGRCRKHYWNETPNGEIVDLTVRQFSQDFPEILVIDKNSSSAKTHYQESRTWIF